MLALVVYESMFGNTAQVATAIASGLREWVPTDVVEAGEAPVTLDEEVVLVVAGGPTHAFSMSRAKTRAEAVAQGAPATQTEIGLRDWLQTVTPGRAALATFDTRADKVRHLPGS